MRFLTLDCFTRSYSPPRKHIKSRTFEDLAAVIPGTINYDFTRGRDITLTCHVWQREGYHSDNEGQ